MRRRRYVALNGLPECLLMMALVADEDEAVGEDVVMVTVTMMMLVVEMW